MKLKLHFQLSGEKQILPLNYQYPISSWIYKVLGTADKNFTDLLHNKGYQLENGKTFKLFCFSKLKFPNKTWRIIPRSDRMEIWSRNAYLEISFLLPEQTEKFVVGLFKNQELFIGDKISGIEMKVEQVMSLSNSIEPSSSPFRFKTLSPMVMGIHTDSSEYEAYESPLYKQYAELIIQNLLDKHLAAGKASISKKDIFFKVIELHQNKKGKPKTELQTIKAHSQSETQVKGWYFDFEIQAPIELIETGIAAGFGSMNSMGFGFCEYIKTIFN
jgi:CRISPR-associated endoribonuclease Cas6